MNLASVYLWAGWLEAILLVFHTTVFNYIALQVYKKNPYYKSAFFKLYLLHSLANYGIVGMLNECLCLATEYPNSVCELPSSEIGTGTGYSFSSLEWYRNWNWS